jgi:ParB family chromosome partitioning protein
MAFKIFKSNKKGENTHQKDGARKYGGYSVAAPAGAAVYGIDVDKIHPNPSQPRRTFTEESITSLAESIKQYGIIQPVVVRCCLGGEGGCVYELIEGERRLRAAKKLGLREMPCIIANTDSRRSAEIALTENIQREQLNIFDEANAISSFMEIYGLSAAEMAKRLSCPKETILKKLALLRLSPEEKAVINSAKLTERHVMSLLSIESEEARRAILKRVASEGASAEATENMVSNAKRESAEQKTEPPAERLGKQVVLMRDVKAFFNTLDRSVDVMRQAGVDVKVEKTDKDHETEILIRIPNAPRKQA